jgi:excinuclease ABC subunit C
MKLRPGIMPTLRPSPNSRIVKLRERVRSMPHEPGVYRWIDAKGEIIYVGKAKNLKQRLRSYVTPTPRVEHFRKRALLENMADLDVTFTSTEMEALILETHLIRTLKPRYNVSLTREKHFVYIRFGLNEIFPSVRIVHRKERDGATYIGPYSNPWTQNQTLELLRGLYPFRDCSMGIMMHDPELFSQNSPRSIPLELTFSRPDRRTPCLDYHIKRCLGPCTGDILPEDYQQRCIDDVLSFYRGDTKPVLETLLNRMQEAAGERKFERAGELRDILSHLEQMKLQSKLFDPNAQSIDAFGFSKDLKEGAVLQARGGNLANEERISLSGSHKSLSSTLNQILPQFYAAGDDIPDVIAIPSQPDDFNLLKQWLCTEAQREIKIVVPKKGELKRLVELAALNAGRRVGSSLDEKVPTV